jgi:hypothetical protein
MDTFNASNRIATVIAAAALLALGCESRQGIGTVDASISDAGDAGADAGDAGDAGSASDAGDGGDAGSPSDAGNPDAGSPDAGPSDLNVLFIGNSYTYVNDLPAMLSQIAATAGVPPTISTSEVVQGGATLQVHWNNGIAQTQIEQGHFTHVVLQGSSLEPLLDFDFADFYAYGEMFENLIVDAGARPTLFVTWARAAGDPIYAPNASGYYFSPGEMQDQVTSGYDTLARQSPNSLLACAGEAFRSAIEQYPDIALQQSDLTHPTVAGTYLAACTFYVALTGQAVPAPSFVPDGLNAQDAASLREVAQIGANCADVQPKAFVVWGDSIENGQSITFPNPDGGPEFDSPFDFGTAGSPITNYFVLTNFGSVAAGIEDGLTLAPPFSWSGDAGYPGGSGSVTVAGGIPYSFCGSSIPAATVNGPADCIVAVSYSGQETGSGLLTLNLTNDYQSGFTRVLQGTSISRALLRISQDWGDFGCTDDTCGGPVLWGGASLNLLVSNRGGSPTTSLGVGTPLAFPFFWGDGGAFPGGAGVGLVEGQSYDHCATQTLGPGQKCVVTVSFSPPTPDGGIYMSAVNLAYSDATGPVTPNANENISGTNAIPFQSRLARTSSASRR